MNELARFPPVRDELHLTKEELQELKELRGGVSHANTSGERVMRASHDAREQLERLNSLVERVILTKKNWGAPDLEVQELIPATSWVGPGGKVVLRIRSDPDAGPTDAAGES